MHRRYPTHHTDPTVCARRLGLGQKGSGICLQNTAWIRPDGTRQHIAIFDSSQGYVVGTCHADTLYLRGLFEAQYGWDPAGPAPRGWTKVPDEEPDSVAVAKFQHALADDRFSEMPKGSGVMRVGTGAPTVVLRRVEEPLTREQEREERLREVEDMKREERWAAAVRRAVGR